MLIGDGTDEDDIPGFVVGIHRFSEYGQAVAAGEGRDGYILGDSVFFTIEADTVPGTDADVEDGLSEIVIGGDIEDTAIQNLIDFKLVGALEYFGTQAG